MKIYNHEISFVEKHPDSTIAEFIYEIDGEPTDFSDKIFTKANATYDKEQSTIVFSVLCSVGWNYNDDIFMPEDTFKAAKTPILKPVNLDHLGQETDKQNNIFGVIIDSYAVDNNLQLVNSYDEMEHIVVATMLWDHYFPKRTASIEKRMNDNKQFVSMECHFREFDYGLKKMKADGSIEEETIVVPRNEETSKLTKYLRSYKGSGYVTISGQKYKIGRILKNQVFTGVAFVEKPANPKSVVFPQKIKIKESIFAAASTDFLENKMATIDEDSVSNNLDKETIMSTVNAEVKETKQSKAECDDMEEYAKLKETYAAKMKEMETMAAKMMETEAKMAEAKKMADEFKVKAEQAEAAKMEAEAKYKEKDAALAGMTQKVEAMTKEKVVAHRLSELRNINQVAFVDADETKAVASLATMNEDAWKTTFAAANKIAEMTKVFEAKASEKEVKEETAVVDDVKNATAEKTSNLAATASVANGTPNKVTSLQSSIKSAFFDKKVKKN
jgi:hypothetical protein